MTESSQVAVANANIEKSNGLSDDPNWWRQAVIYQIYPRSFQDTDGDGLGDIKGVTKRVDYLSSLGIDAVWLSPFYPSPLADGGYDVADYMNVDPRLGSLEDFDEMLNALHSVGIRVFVDIVPNHTSNQYPWFQEALASPPGSPARSRYHFYDGQGENGELPPSDWPSFFAPSAWTRTTNPDGTPGQWYLHLFAPEQPDLNWDHPEVPALFLQVLKFWADRGVDGFRIDVAHAMQKDMSQPFRSYPQIKEMETPDSGDGVLLDRNEIHDTYKTWRKLFNQYNPPRVAVAEAMVRAERRVAYTSPDELGQAFNFDLLLSEFNAAQFHEIISRNLGFAQKSGSSSTWVLSNHDQPRHATKYGLPKIGDAAQWLMTEGKSVAKNREVGLARARAATMLILALPGCTYLYQGEELGLDEVETIPFDEIQDPMWERLLHTKKGRDGCRVPLPWQANANSFGFSSGNAHLPQPDWFGSLAVDQQDGVAGSTLEMYRQAIHIRKQVLAGESFEWIENENPEVLHFARDNGWQSVTNFSGSSVPLPAGELLIASVSGVTTELPANSTAWLQV